MRYLIGMLALAGCTTTAERPAPAGPCAVSEQLRMRFVGTEFRMSVREEMEALGHSRTSRVLRPNDVATTDYRPDRLNIEVDDAGRVSGLRCG